MPIDLLGFQVQPVCSPPAGFGDPPFSSSLPRLRFFLHPIPFAAGSPEVYMSSSLTTQGWCSLPLPEDSSSINVIPLRTPAVAFRAWTGLVITVLMTVLAGTLLYGFDAEPPQLMTVEKGPFRVEVKTSGTIVPLKNVRVASECHWTVRILSLVPEGTWVRKGDIVCVLDSSEIEEFLRSREVTLISADASLQASLQREELLKASNDRRLTEARHQLESAELDLREYSQGTYPQQMEQLSDEIHINGDRLTSVADDYAFAEQMWSLGFANRAEIEAASLQLTTQAEQLRRLEAQKAMFEKFSHPRKETQLAHSLNLSRLTVLRTELANSLAGSKARLGTLSEERRLLIYRRNVEAARDSIKACTLRAPRDGQVFHANNWNLQSRGIISIQEGKSVYFSQPIFEIPDQDHLKISLPLNEALITHVSVGMPIKVAPSGFESEEVFAEITRISPYPVPRRYAPDVQEYWLDAVLRPSEHQREFLHPRMEAEATITLMEKKDAISVPREAIVRCSGQNVVLLSQRETLLPCPVFPGEVADGKVMIESGLHEGDQIVAAITDQQRESLTEKITAADDAGGD